MELRVERAGAEGVAELFALADAYGLSLYPAESYYALPPESLDEPGTSLVVAREGGAALGMGAVVVAPDGTAELKRMFVRDDARGRGLASAILAELERIARAAGVREVRLETGPPQVAAIALYERSGYARIPNFGPYVGDEHSLCFAKPLAP